MSDRVHDYHDGNRYYHDLQQRQLNIFRRKVFYGGT